MQVKIKTPHRRNETAESSMKGSTELGTSENTLRWICWIFGSMCTSGTLGSLVIGDCLQVTNEGFAATQHPIQSIVKHRQGGQDKKQTNKQEYR
jgi:hypothetical protein